MRLGHGFATYHGAARAVVEGQGGDHHRYVRFLEHDHDRTTLTLFPSRRQLRHRTVYCKTLRCPRSTGLQPRRTPFSLLQHPHQHLLHPLRPVLLALPARRLQPDPRFRHRSRQCRDLGAVQLLRGLLQCRRRAGGAIPQSCRCELCGHDAICENRSEQAEKAREEWECCDDGELCGLYGGESGADV